MPLLRVYPTLGLMSTAFGGGGYFLHWRDAVFSRLL